MHAPAVMDRQRRRELDEDNDGYINKAELKAALEVLLEKELRPVRESARETGSAREGERKGGRKEGGRANERASTAILVFQAAAPSVFTLSLVQLTLCLELPSNHFPPTRQRLPPSASTC